MPTEIDLSSSPEPVAFAPDPAAVLPRGAAVVIVGAGVLGSSTAYRLAAAGVSPLVIEANAPATGASGRNAGMLLQGLGGHFARVTDLVQQAGARSILDYTTRSADLLAALDEELPGGIEFDRSGSLDLLLDDSQRQHAEDAAAAQRVEGLEVQIIGPWELGELEPAVDKRLVVGAKWTPSDATLNPFNLNFGLLHAAMRRGAQVITGVRVERLIERGGRIAGVSTSHGDVETDAVLVAANAWTGALVPQLAPNLTPIREHVCVTEPIERLLGAGFETNRCNEYWRQMRSGEIVIGGFASADEGMGIGSYSMEVRSAIPPRLAALLGAIVPAAADARIVRCWAGLLDFASLEVPMVGRLPDESGQPVPGGYVACGLTGHGMPYASVFGLLLAELITLGDARTLPLEPFDPRRYVGKRHPPTWLEPFETAGPTLRTTGSATSPAPR